MIYDDLVGSEHCLIWNMKEIIFYVGERKIQMSAIL